MDLRNQFTVNVITELCRTVVDHSRAYYSVMVNECNKPEFFGTFYEPYIDAIQIKPVVIALLSDLHLN